MFEAILMGFIALLFGGSMYLLGRIDGKNEVLRKFMPNTALHVANLEETQRLLKELRVAAQNWKPKK